MSGTYDWTAVSGAAGASADSQNFLGFSALPPGLLYISGISVDLGSGLIYDLEAGAPGFDQWGAFSTSFGTTGGSTVTGPVSGDHAPVVFSFTDFDPGEAFSFFADLDDDNDTMSGADFAAGGRASLLLTFSAAAGYYIVGSNTVAVDGITDGNWVDGALTSSNNWGGTIEVEAIPEPSTFAFLGGGLLGLGLLARRFRK